LVGAAGRVEGQIRRTQLGDPLLEHLIPRVQPIRSAITVAGIVRTRSSCARMASSNASTADPDGFRSYFGGASEAIAARTVFRDPQRRRDRLDR
jgi:hypothetical protein